MDRNKTCLANVKYQHNRFTKKQYEQLNQEISINCLYKFNDLIYISNRDNYKTGLQQLKTLKEETEQKLTQKLTNESDNSIDRKKTKRRRQRLHNYSGNKKKKQNEESFGQYYVEEILDYAVNADGKLMFYVKWYGWGDEDCTWEVEKNLDGCPDALDQFYEKRGNFLAKYSTEEIEKLIQHLNQITSNQYDDACILLKLNNKSMKSFDNSKNSLNNLKRNIQYSIESLNEVIRITGKSNRIKELRKVNLTVDHLKIFQHFGSITGFFEYFQKRNNLLKQLSNWENKQNQVILKNNDGPPITIENLTDLESPPDMIYITKNQIIDNEGNQVEFNDTSYHGCDCTNCYENRDQCCSAIMGFTCFYNNKGILARETDIIFECNSKCKCDIDCPNRVVQKGRKLKLGVFRTENGTRGWGVKTLEPIPKGSFVMEYVGELISLSAADDRPRTYLFDLESRIDANDVDYTYVIDAEKYGNIARFVNHSCDPNLTSIFTWIDNYDKLRPRIALFAKKNIKINSELTYDYGITLFDIVSPKIEYVPKQTNYNDDDEYTNHSKDSGIDSIDKKSDNDDSNSDLDSCSDSDFECFSKSKRLTSKLPKRSNHNPIRKIECLCKSANCIKTLYV